MTKNKGLPLTSNHWGTYRAKVKNGKVEELVGWEHDKDPSPIAQGIVDVLDGPTRIDKPMVRKSWFERGPGANNNLRGVEPLLQLVGIKQRNLSQTKLIE